MLFKEVRYGNTWYIFYFQPQEKTFALSFKGFFFPLLRYLNQFQILGRKQEMLALMLHLPQ